MKKIIMLFLYLILLIYSCSLFAQDEKKSCNRFGIEEGAGYNTASSSIIGKRNLFWIQPTARIFYSFKLHDISENKKIKMPVFIGYYTFGGLRNVNFTIPEDSLSNENLLFRSIEYGVNPCVEINNLQMGLLFKAQYVFSAIDKLYYSGYKETIIINDVSKSYKNYAANAGLKIRLKIKKFSIGTEAWFGIINLYYNTSLGGKLTENNYRFLLGYEF